LGWNWCYYRVFLSSIFSAVCTNIFFGGLLCILMSLLVWAGKGEPTRIFGNKVGPGLSEGDKIWRVFSALGNIALACSYATVVYDIMVKMLYCNSVKQIELRGVFIWLFVHYIGHFEVTSTRMQTDEKGQCVWNHSNDVTFPAMWWPWLCCFRGSDARKHPHRLWILRAILVGCPWQCVHCNPHGGSISGSISLPVTFLECER